MSRDEKLLWNAEEDTIHDPSRMKLEMTSEQKWQNFWYYHKTHVIIGVVAVLFVGFLLFDLLSKVSPDYTVGLITQNTYPDTVISRLEEEFAAQGEDLNKDGKVIVRIAQYTIIDQEKQEIVDGEAQLAMQTKLMADLTACESVIFLADEESFKKFQEGQQLFSYLDGSTPEKGASDYERMKVPWGESSFLTGMDLKGYTEGENGGQIPLDYQEYMGSLNLALRVFAGTAPSKDAGKVDYYNSSVELFEKIAK